MVDVFRFTHPGLMDPVLFRDEEIELLDANPFRTWVEQESQSGHVTMVPVGTGHFIFSISFHAYYRDTVEKLDMMREAQDNAEDGTVFRFWPFWLYDQTTVFEVLWTNIAEFFERHQHGRIAAQWSQPVIMKEVVAGTCPVPS